ncbi:Physaropepsin [Tieghemostelium lacteum]|uniref:Physaropepsin n=1 Tax=Tieghemostelium lacteum TaxID=361077 RepID=A0A151Z8W0_TIELA|nr:Physaropepsin [Tieghemostelium lacteum]|eukprot:KYQ90377.1 Physaropepsin [Tieghemostelium lacteum]
MSKLISLLFVVCLVVVPSFAILRDTANWTQVKKAASAEVVDFRIALTQRNVDKLEEALLDVSTPFSKNYGNHWSIDEILDLVAPEPKVARSVMNYLKNNGCFNIVNQRDHIKAAATVEAIEKMFSVKMFTYQSNISGSQIVRSSGFYTIPKELSGKVDLVAGISELPFRKAGPKAHARKATPVDTSVDPGIVIPEVLYNLYNIPVGFNNNAQTSICLAEFADDQSFNKNDLKVFSTKTATELINVDKIVGPYSPQQPDLESTLDVQYGGAVAQNASVWFWTVAGWMYEFSTDLFAANPAPYIVSMSWGWTESQQCESGIGNCNGETSQEYVTRVNTEFMKIGLRGISLLAASGDQGAPGDGNPSCSNNKMPISPIFPGGSPWVTSVGATMLSAPSDADMEGSSSGSTAPICQKQKCATSTSEVVCSYPQALITSGGGFSDYSPMPSYQQTAVNAYLNSGVKLPTGKFNATNRGFPDVSALGHNYWIVASGAGQIVDGTSCSSPVFGGIVALLNSIRLNNGKATLGFLNPFLYAAQAADSTTFTDITSGNNLCTESCCAKFGFQATSGWDAASGLGTPQFKSLANYVESLN